MKTSIILIAYHADPWLKPCLESLAHASADRQHLVLVDNSGNTIIEEMDLSAWDAEVLTTPRPMGFTDANNFALVNATHLEASVLLLNQDTISTQGWIDSCLRRFSDDSNVAIVSPLIRNYDDTKWDPSFIDCLEPGQAESLNHMDPLPPELNVSHVPAPAMFVRTAMLREVGPLDPIFVSYYEDYDLCMRIRQAGGRIICACDSMIQHYSGSSTNNRERELRRMRQVIRNLVIYEARSQGNGRLIFVLKSFLIAFPRRLLGGVLRREGARPPIVTLLAYKDLLGLAPRLFSRRKDASRWKEYLRSIEWSS